MNTFTRHDAERLETLTKTVSGFRKKAGVTTLDLLIACRFELANKYEWEEAIEAAQERHEAFCAYYDTGRNEEDAMDRKIAALEAEIARLRDSANVEAYNDMMRVGAAKTNGIGRDFVIQHVDGNLYNNAPSNLRYVTMAENRE